jgi:hypothetical protein
MDLGRAAAVLLVDDLARGRPVSGVHVGCVERYLASIPDGEGSPHRAPRDACRELLAGGGPAAEGLPAALLALLEAEIY